MADLITKLLNKNEVKDVAHSSAYAKAQNESGFGAASTQSFSDRMKMEQNRQHVRGYRDAKVMSEQGREAWRVRQEARQMGTDTGGVAGLKGTAGDAAGGNSANKNSRGGTNFTPPAMRNPGVSR